jgi:hypothetical protein
VKRQDPAMETLRAAAVRRVRDAATWRPHLALSDLWPLLQATAAATVAWSIATRVVDHPEPFFAPISALVALNTSLGERGLNALRLLEGVVIGIAAGELTLLTIGGGYGSLAVATFVALVAARAVGGARVVLAQAAVSAILTIAVANGEVGYQRLSDALIGAGVALVFSQLLFSPEPLRLLRRVETNALAAMAAALELTARALEGDEGLAERAIGSQRELRDHLSELARVRRASTRVARHSLAWRARLEPVVREKEDAGHLDLLGGSCLLLTRAALEAAGARRRLLTPSIRSLSATLADLARQPGDRATRQAAVGSSLETLRSMRALDADPDPELTAALTAARFAVTDLLLFVGVDPDEARAATREEERNRPEPEVRTPAAPREGRFRRLRGRLRRRFRRR